MLGRFSITIPYDKLFVIGNSFPAHFLPKIGCFVKKSVLK